MAEYDPGVCNIGPAEQRKRYILGGSGFAAAVLFILYGNLLPYQIVTHILLFTSLLAGFEGIYQGYLGFCAGFALQRVYDVSQSGDGRHRVEDEEAHRQDMQKAWRIHGYSFASSMLLTGFFILLRIPG
ncbi:MAG: hypothetical protein SVU32_00995 [Candidatus Nanohaloarchaea archaeon]|nr:hypothetical protein [Candidatus Nanohaloarchaea archaeon]